MPDEALWGISLLGPCLNEPTVLCRLVSFHCYTPSDVIIIIGCSEYFRGRGKAVFAHVVHSAQTGQEVAWGEWAGRVLFPRVWGLWTPF